MVSIIIPYYNRPEKLRRCLSSVLEQTYKDFEILVVDDHSTIPLTLDIDPRITVYRNQKNLGPGASRNVGLANAKGEYIAFLDSDDYWDSEFLKNCVEHFHDKTDISMVFANGYQVNETEEIIGIRRRSAQISNSILPRILQGTRHWGTGGCLWKSEYLKNVTWQPSTPWEDYAFDIDVAINCNKIIGVKDCLVYYDTTGSDKISRQNWEQALLGKSKSLTYISKSLWDSQFRDEFGIREAVTTQLINNIIAIIESKLNNKFLIRPITKELKNWNGIPMWVYLKFILNFPANIQLRLLRRLKSLECNILS